ncbi:hypothetical protein [Thiocapsa marina]|uniref:Cysteinyl-tRNA synthetase n=1 Tax=Thiocapsa marina 5811 TaxID=768671 RepID=F9U6C1_9GAMM|nr:hypothetical protein [Thiocapsa marina]EGV20694.1 hypothetical protein ThimaDRAFT_0472 [Thiocapsa marina 5811]
MQRLEIDGLTFDFPDGWRVGRYDNWRFYRNHFGKMWHGIKALDALAVETESSRTAWLIEVKDYRSHDRTKPSALSEEVARKLFDTLSAILPAKLNAAEPDEKRLAQAVCGARRLRVILHLEQPTKRSRLRPHAINPADVQQQLRRLIKPIDAHPRVVSRQTAGLPWQVF